MGFLRVGQRVTIWFALSQAILSLFFSKSIVSDIDKQKGPRTDKGWIPALNSTRKQYDICVVGAGLSGSVIAERYASQLRKSVLILEKRDHIGGNCYDYLDEETGIRVSKYGAHLFHTKSERVWNYVNQFAVWAKYEHKVLGLVNSSTYVPIPVNIHTVNTLFGWNINTTEEMDEWLRHEQLELKGKPRNSEEMALSRVGPRLYELIFRPYTLKQWGREPHDLGPEVTARIPVRNNRDERYFDDRYQALPIHGYTAFFERLLDNPLIDIRLNTDFFRVRDSITCHKTYFTGPIDAYYSHLGWPKLEYRSLEFERRVIRNVGFFQPSAVVNYPSLDTIYTRSVEYKQFLNQSSPHTILFLERSADSGEPYYPVPNPKNKALYLKYQIMAEKEPNVTFVGRLANYKYFNMDEAILNALKTFDEDTTTEIDDVVNSTKHIRDTFPKYQKSSQQLNEFQSGHQGASPKTHWCILSKSTLFRSTAKYFKHFPHASEGILPCWSWFRKQNATSNCGFVLMDGLTLVGKNGQEQSWQRQLVDTMGCQVQHSKLPLPPNGLPLPSHLGLVQHVPNLYLQRPRYGQIVYLDRPDDAHALRRLLVDDRTIAKVKGPGKRLQIGILQRTRSRIITNLDEIVHSLQRALPESHIVVSELKTPLLREQAEWFATKDIIIAAHGAALTNSIFITPGTIVMQLYPPGFFWQSLDPLIEQSGGIALDWYKSRSSGVNPVVDWQRAKAQNQHNKARESNITASVHEIVEPILMAIGAKLATRDAIQSL